MADHNAASFLSGENRRAAGLRPHPPGLTHALRSVYAEEMFAAWRQDPSSVHKSWDVFFRKVRRGAAGTRATSHDLCAQGVYTPPPTLGLTEKGASAAAAAAPASGPAGAMSAQQLVDAMKIVQMVRAFQVRGHYMADIDPLKLHSARRGLVQPGVRCAGGALPLPAGR